MIGMGDRGILIFVSEPLLTFFPETKSGCFLSLRVNIRIVNDRMCFFNYVIPYTDPFGRYKEMIQNVFLGQFVCVCVKLEVMTFRSMLLHPQFAYGAPMDLVVSLRWCDLRWVLFKLQDSRS